MKIWPKLSRLERDQPLKCRSGSITTGKQEENGHVATSLKLEKLGRTDVLRVTPQSGSRDSVRAQHAGNSAAVVRNAVCLHYDSSALIQA